MIETLPAKGIIDLYKFRTIYSILVNSTKIYIDGNDSFKTEVKMVYHWKYLKKSFDK